MSTTLAPVQQSAPEIAALKEFYEKQGKLKGYTKEFRIARNATEEKIEPLPIKFIPKWCKALDDAGVPTFDARRIVEADAKSLGWKERVILKALPRHYKNPTKMEVGAKGGQATATARRGLAAASEEVRKRVATSGGQARAHDSAGLARAGRKGGQTVSQTYGTSYFSEIGSKAHDDDKQEEPAVEQLLTGEFQVNPLEWQEQICSIMEQAKADGRNVVFTLAESRLVTVRQAGVSATSTAQTG